jgi:hypothetical protein
MRLWILKILALVAALAAINYPALLNGYPLLYSDSGTYIVAGFIDYVPVDRPYFYSWFLRHASMWYSLWLVLLAQSLILLYVTRLALRYVLNVTESFISTCLLLTGLGLVTGLSYNSSQLMADVFSPIALLCFGVLFAGKDIKGKHRFGLVILLLFSISVHSSHLLIISLLAALLWLLRIVFKKKEFFRERKKNQRRVIFWGLAAWLVVSMFNSWLGVGFRPSRTGNVFLVARCIETGAAKVYLDKHCPFAAGGLCDYKDSLPPHAVAFLWEFETSPLYDNDCTQNGWGDCWTQKDADFGVLVKDIVAYGPSRRVLVDKCVSDSWKQLGAYDLGFLTPMAEGSPVYGGIRDFFGREMPQYQSAEQYTETLYFPMASKIQRWMVYLSLLVIVFFAVKFYRQKNYSATLAFAAAMVVGCVVNGVVCASFSGVVDRYMARMIWLLPMAAAFLVWQWILLRKQKTIN